MLSAVATVVLVGLVAQDIYELLNGRRSRR